MSTSWKKNISKYPIFSYFLSVEVNRDSFRDKILEVDNIFLSLANQFQLFTLSTPNSQNFNDTLKVYNDDRLETFSRRDSEYDYLRFLDFKQGVLFSKYSGTTLVFDESTNAFLNVPNQIDCNNSIFNIEATGDYQLRELDDNYTNVQVGMSIFSYSNIWLDTFNFDESRVFKGLGDVKNRVVAYRMTPRLNSFLRDFKNKLELLGIELKQQECDTRYVTEEGILLDGRIIYQEDIDEGRVMVPV